jgi:hypothetical protein
MNGFLELAKRQLGGRCAKTRDRARPRRRRQNSARTRGEPDRQLQYWQQWRGERLQSLLSGPHGQAAWQLMQFLDKMTIHDAPALIKLVKPGKWQRADPDTRFEVLALIDEHIIKLREAHGLAPMDDGLTDEDLTALQQIREMLQ